MGPDVGYSWISGPVRMLGVAGPVAGMKYQTNGIGIYIWDGMA